MTDKTTTETGRPRTVVVLAEILSALAKVPRTVGGLVDYTDADEETVKRWLKELERSGLVHKRGSGKAQGGATGRKPDLWALQPWPFAYTDNPSPDSVVEAERKRFEAAAVMLGFDTTRSAKSGVHEWEQYENPRTGHRWAGWLARVGV